jgi:hypothetical protein
MSTKPGSEEEESVSVPLSAIYRQLDDHLGPDEAPYDVTTGIARLKAWMSEDALPAQVDPGQLEPSSTGGLSELERRILAFEQAWWRLPGAKKREIPEKFGIPVTRYYSLLDALIDRPEAAKLDPVLVARLRRQRSRRRQAAARSPSKS